MRIKLYILVACLSCALLILFGMIGNRTGTFKTSDQLNVDITLEKSIK